MRTFTLARTPARKARTFAPLLSLALVLLPAACHAQRGLRTLTGTVTNFQKEPVKGAVVQVLDEVSNSIVSFLTLADGSFSFKRLSANSDYWVTATYRGRRSKRKELSHFNGSTHPTINLILKPR